MTRKDQIAEAAFALFAERGYADVRMDDVAERAGVAKGTVYLHYADKEALFRAVITRKLAPATEALDRLAAADAHSSEEALRQLYAHLAAVIDSGVLGVLLRLVVSEAPRFPELAETHFRTIVAPTCERLSVLLENGVEKGEFRRAPIGDYPMALIAPALMTAQWRLLFGHIAPLDTQRFLDAFAELAVEGLKPRGEPE